MRLDPILMLCVGGPLALTALALSPVSFSGADATTAPDAVEVSLPALETGWIDPLTQRLTAQQARQAVVVDQDPFEGWELVGLVQADDGVWVTLVGGGEVRTLTVGDALMGYTLARVEDAEAVFRREEDEYALRLAR